MTMTKNVNGVDITLTAEEEAEVRAQWAANAPTLDDLKAAKQAEINAKFEAESAVLTAGYPESEQKTWPSQEAEALAWQADNTVPTPYLDAIAADRHIAPEDMRTRTLAKVVFFKTESASLLGTKQRLSDAIIAAQDQAALDVITWPPAT